MRYTILTLTGVALLAACGGNDDAAAGDTAGAMMNPPAMTSGDSMAGGMTGGSATAMLRDAAGHDLGTLTLTDAASGISVSGMLHGMPPGEHGIHIHTAGSCEPTFAAAGGHWNPTNAQHGRDNPQGPHFGDLGNITVGADSMVTVQATSPGGSLRGTNALMDTDGAAIVVHAGADDNRTDPAGASGDRIACGAVSGG